MKELAGRLSALDPDAGAAIQVIAYFDRLVADRAGLEAIVRGAAVLAGCPARLVDADRRVRVRVLADGLRQDAGPPPDPQWPTVPVPGGTARLWLERPGPAGPVGAMVLERAAAAAREVLDRTRGRAPSKGRREDPALVELLLDASAPREARLQAARDLGLAKTAPARAVALEGGEARIVPGSPPADPSGDLGGRRAGIGPAVPVLDLPDSWPPARTALRLAAEGTDQDPGPRVVYADELGGLAVLAAAVGPGSEPPPDVRSLDHAGAAAPWMLPTLHAFAYAPSLRTAAAELTVHHSTLQDRLAHAEHLLGWSVRTPRGRLRLQLAFALRRLHRHPV
ncbi:hypothetical protein Misp01_48140 [Microtetraspora sp. NBRC 13810]|uniref:helix-turn-helix domain-containing protein n=1 Tax=Microtetraspora sp. NBRC 13810 TaxID=3030990 RepID=UPI0024A17252|nr:helix-turn-helix domain-containing protein [Microtetraspora sp. NBRC 13810]GLW09685.1 hypothetical protein Misp01_48140 [Microtetraspora sp. NBRC 13810]